MISVEQPAHRAENPWRPGADVIALLAQDAGESLRIESLLGPVPSQGAHDHRRQHGEQGTDFGDIETRGLGDALLCHCSSIAEKVPQDSLAVIHSLIVGDRGGLIEDAAIVIPSQRLV